MQAIETVRAVSAVIDALRRGEMVALVDDSRRLVFSSVEAVVGEMQQAPQALVLEGARVNHLLPHRPVAQGAQRVAWSLLKTVELAQIMAGMEEPADAELRLSGLTITPENTVNMAQALALLARAALLPALFCFDDDVAVSAQCTLAQWLNFSAAQAVQLKKVADAALVLRGDIAARLVGFRVQGSAEEHYALCVEGLKPSVRAPLVRVHSSCFTGDLLDSLACDCHDQLHQAIQQMAADSGGVLLYLMQEGRGIGLINKLRAYVLKSAGLDTVDANYALGFVDDARGFELAVAMLQNLGIASVRLLTNNPRKAEALVAGGVVVEECVSLHTGVHEHNREYLQTKAARLGHSLLQDGDYL